MKKQNETKVFKPDNNSLPDLSGKAKWYYPRGLNNIFWRKKYFYKYSKWIWGNDLLYIDIPKVDIILYMLKPFKTPLLTILQTAK